FYPVRRPHGSAVARSHCITVAVFQYIKVAALLGCRRIYSRPWSANRGSGSKPPALRKALSHGVKSGRLLNSAMNRSGRFIGASLRINLQQLREASFIGVAHRTIPV